MTVEHPGTPKPIITQFLAGSPEGPIGMDEMADAGDDISRYIESGTTALQFGPLARPDERALAAHAPADQPIPPQ
jgi:hypothetical protein